MKVAMVSFDASPLQAAYGVGNGQSVHVAELAKELGGKGHHVIVYTHKNAPDLRDRVRVASGVTVEHLPAGPVKRLSAQEMAGHIPEFGRHLADCWLRDRPDVVHAHSWLSGLATLAAQDRGDSDSIRNDIPVVQSFYGLARGVGPRQRLEAALARTATAVTTGGADEADALIRTGVPRRNIRVVPDGVDVDRFTPEGPAYARSETPRLLAPLLPAAGVRTATAALAWIPDAEIVVAGGPPREEIETDPEMRHLRTLATKAGVGDRITLLGQVGRKDMPRLLRSADLVVCAPPNGPADRVPLEAMACGVPVVTTAAGGQGEMVIDNVTGVHVPAGRPADMAVRVRELLADSTLRTAYGIAAADRARSRYSWDRIGQETLRVYEGVSDQAAATAGAGSAERLPTAPSLRA
jgi:glycosyltransferase involved in cell wall biosynthesis